MTEEEKIINTFLNVKEDSFLDITDNALRVLCEDYLERARRKEGALRVIRSQADEHASIPYLKVNILNILMTKLREDVTKAFRDCNSIESYDDLIENAFGEFKKGVDKELNK